MMRRGTSRTSPASSSSAYRYRTRAATCQVDESLFSTPKLKNKYENSTFKVMTKERETVLIITKDQIRSLTVPKERSQEPLHLSSSQVQRILSSSRVLTKTENEAQRQAYQKKKDEEITAAEVRKQQIIELDLLRKQKKPQTQEVIAARDRTRRFLEQANELRMEQDEDIKKVNRVILEAQCQAKREIQINEKKKIQAEMAEKEKHLDTMMEMERRKAVGAMEKICELHKQKLKNGMLQICSQIQQRREDKKFVNEMKMLENDLTREEQEKMKQEDLMAQQKKREDQQRFRKEITRINAETMLAKKQRIEEEKLADVRDKEYIAMKLKQEAEQAAEQSRIKKSKEKEIAKLLAQQKKSKDKKAQQDEVYARIVKEMKDREWRRKEKELAEKKAQAKAMMRSAQLEHQRSKEQQMLIEVGRQRMEFDKVMSVQQDVAIKLQEKEEQQHLKAQHYKEALQRQLKERESLGKTQRKEVFKGVDKEIEEAHQRQMCLDMMKEKKLNAFKATGVSDKYYAVVHRKIFDRKAVVNKAGTEEKQLKAQWQMMLSGLQAQGNLQQTTCLSPVPAISLASACTSQLQSPPSHLVCPTSLSL
ncbi:cilia- and flagella-associated protein 45-like [Notolabrus celidotus]|uniref:cilia- and flagella-associated protein 45-like n=1 Tax=Notolabrus celidotus TaxID=1203425 RepID=UPI00148F4778|nr:cilia- and flagella-associated protein 45-like [Notolabrus celidotus]